MAVFRIEKTRDYTVMSNQRVQHHMKHLEIKSIVIKKYQYQKNHGQVPDDKENILNRNFE